MPRKPDEFAIDDLREFLINGGVEGRTQSEIVRKLRNRISAQRIREELEAMLNKLEVQKFVIQKDVGGPVTIWRATTKMMED